MQCPRTYHKSLKLKYILYVLLGILLKYTPLILIELEDLQFYLNCNVNNNNIIISYIWYPNDISVKLSW